MALCLGRSPAAARAAAEDAAPVALAMTDKKNALVLRPAMTREEFEAKFAEFYAELARRAEPDYPVILVDRAGGRDHRGTARPLGESVAEASRRAWAMRHRL